MPPRPPAAPHATPDASDTPHAGPSAAGGDPAAARRRVASWQDALDRLYGFTNWETRPPGTPHTFALERIERLLAALGQPHHAWPAVHVGGTNGKGSTCAFIAAALQAAGYRVGRFTSPHMHTVRERMRVDDRLITEGEVIAWLDTHGALLDSLPGLTTFEVMTALASDHFRAAGVDLAVVEVGLGGRLDTTRVVRPIVSVLTPIGLDHREILGDTIRQIASDKVGIFSPGVPVVSAPQEHDAAAVIDAEVKRLGCPLWRVGRDTRWHVVPATRPPAIAVAVAGPGGSPDDAAHYTFVPGLHGAHQQVNAAVAATALTVLDRTGWPVPSAAIAAGLEAARWPGRYERWPTPAGGTLVVDGAHNPHGAAALVAALADVDPAAGYVFVLGFGGGKDVDGMLDVVLPRAAAVVAVQADHPKALPADAVAARVAARRPDLPVTAHGADVAAALDAAVMAAGDGVAVATGSIFVAADVREAWLERLGTPVVERDAPRPKG